MIDKFVNLLGRNFSELTDDEKARASAPVIDSNGVPAFNVAIDDKQTTLTVHDVAVRFLRSLFLTAKDFLSGVPIAGAVLSVPHWYAAPQIAALKHAATEAGLIVLQTISAPAAALAAYGLTSPQPQAKLPAHPDGVEGEPYPAAKQLDRNVVVLDVGGTSTDVTVVAARAGLYSALASTHDATVGGVSLDHALIQFFAKEFTKKTKITIQDADKRAWAKLRNEAEFTKRALSASNSAQCSVESLAEGIDFTGSINRMRFDMLAGASYAKIVANVEKALAQAALDASQVDEVILAGGSARLTGLSDRLSFVFPESTHITASIDADQVVARGCAVQAQAIAATPDEAPERKFLLSLPAQPVSSLAELSTKATSKPLGLVIPAPAQADDKLVVDGKLFVTLLPANTPLPARRAYRLPVASGAESVVLRLETGTPAVRVDEIKPEEPEPEQLEEDDEPLEPEQVKTAYVKPDGKAVVELVVPLASKGAKKVQVDIEIDANNKLSVAAKEEGADKPAASVQA